MGSCDRIVQHRTSRAQGSGLSEGGTWGKCELLQQSMGAD